MCYHILDIIWYENETFLAGPMHRLMTTSTNIRKCIFLKHLITEFKNKWSMHL